jgi:hypothetical protein
MSYDVPDSSCNKSKDTISGNMSLSSDSGDQGLNSKERPDVGESPLLGAAFIRLVASFDADMDECAAARCLRRCHPEEALYLPTFSHLFDCQ